MEIYYSVRTVFGTFVSTSKEEYIESLKSARVNRIPYHVVVDKIDSFTFVALFADWNKFTPETYKRI